jgi:hypothetical protein
MSETDELVNGWVKEKFLKSHQYLNNTLRYGTPEQIKVLKADVEAYCGCYSEYTRDDGVDMVALLEGRSGEFKFTVGLWGNLPQFIEELDAYQYTYTDCPYDEEDEDYYG